MANELQVRSLIWLADDIQYIWEKQSKRLSFKKKKAANKIPFSHKGEGLDIKMLLLYKNNILKIIFKLWKSI
jgi:hypothetical protein